MAHSIQEYRGRYIILNDIDLAAFVAVLHDVAQEHSDDKLATVLSRWDHALEIAGPGTIDLEVDVIIHCTKDRDHFLGVLANIRARIARFGEIIPPSVLERTARIADVQFSEYFPAHVVLRVAESLDDALRAGSAIEAPPSPPTTP